MDPSKLSDYQLYEIIQNENLDKDLRKLANSEFNSRKLSIHQIEEIISRHDSLYKPVVKGLNPWIKLLLVLFPFVIPIQSIFAGQFLARGSKKKWKEYWFYLSMGYLFWTIVIILYFRFVVNHGNAAAS